MVHKAKKRHRSWEAVSHHSLPDWRKRKANEYLLHGHRPDLSSYTDCYKSIFQLHSETGNIWTHLIGCIVFFIITGAIIYSPLDMLHPRVQLYDQVVFVIYGVGAALCMTFSFLFHTLSCHSEGVSNFFQRLDYCGISVLIMASFVPWLYYSFYCHWWPKVFYMSLVTVLGVACSVISLLERFNSSHYRPFRATLFVVFGLSGVLPALHYVLAEGIYSAIYVAALHWLVLMACLYILGAFIYAKRIPERLYPGKFDIWGQSHQIFHILVVAAALVHYHGVKIVANNMAKDNVC